MSEEQDSRRDDVEAAWDKVEAGGEAAPAAEVAPVVKEAVEPATKEAAEAAPEVVAEAKGDRGRDDKGRFAKGEAKTETKAPVIAAKAATRPDPTAAKVATVPPAVVASSWPKELQSWKPAAREEWGKIPKAAQEEISRRERDISVALNGAAAQRQFGEQYRTVVGPFEAMIRAEGGEPLQAIGSLLQTAQALRTAPIDHKVEIVARMIGAYGIPLDKLDARLAGQAPQPGQAHPQDMEALLERKFKERETARERMRIHGAATQASTWADRAGLSQEDRNLTADVLEATAQAGVSMGPQDAHAFAQKHEFVRDVLPAMAALGAAYRARGVAKSADDLYAQAVQMDPELSGIVQQREAAKRAATPNGATQRARTAAAVSIKSQPAPEVGEEDDPKGRSRMADLNAAWDEVAGR